MQMQPHESSDNTESMYMSWKHFGQFILALRTYTSELYIFDIWILER